MTDAFDQATAGVTSTTATYVQVSGWWGCVGVGVSVGVKVVVGVGVGWVRVRVRLVLFRIAVGLW